MNTALLKLFLAAAPVSVCAAAPSVLPSLAIPDSGWKLWLDLQAKWQSEAAYLPGEATLAQIEARPPTGGWSVLANASGKVVTLPTTVEQHYWGEGGLRPYRGEYFYEQQDKEPRNGNYEGVSWWTHDIKAPESFAGKVAILHIRGAKQRAEVYVNHKLVGYGFIAETAFDCDVTKALKPGQTNSIAIRITNPGGRLDWGDWSTATMGKYTVFGGHAFGGLDRGITLTAHEPLRLSDAYVLNTPEPHAINAYAVLQNDSDSPQTQTVRFTVPGLVQQTMQSKVPAHSNQTVHAVLSAPNAKLWDLEHPNLYHLNVDLGLSSIDHRQLTFGFRWFGPTGIGQNAVLRLNGNRIRVVSAISWGFWGINGLWPTPMLAEKEVRTAKKLGLKAINFHRNVAREESLDVADRLGLLRYTEPGGGMTMFWQPDTQNPLQRYMEEKIVRMVRDHRSHPSLTMYVIQNELNDGDYKHTLAEKMIRRIHEEDPSRPAILKSGLGPNGQMWMMPYDNTLYVDKGDGYSGWWDNHTVGTPDSWVDANYKSPTDYVYRNTNAKEIIDYGEMGGSGTGDNHPLMLQQIKALGGKSYDLVDHQEVNDAYEKFLTQYGFRASFPTVQGLFEQIGAKQYDYWQNVIQCARLSDENDYLTISGWESTAVENHSGLVDALRNPHGDPQVLANALRPVLPALQLRKSAVVPGEAVTYDLFFINETNHPVSGQLEVTLKSPSGKVTHLGSYAVPTFKQDVFSYFVAQDLKTPSLNESGTYTLTYSLGNISQSKVIRAVFAPTPTTDLISIVGHGSRLASDLADLKVRTTPYNPSYKCPLVICTSDMIGQLTTSNIPARSTPDPELYRAQRYGQPTTISFSIGDLPNGPAKVTLGFTEAYYSAPGSRVFNVNINGQTVLSDLDIVKQAGGKDTVWTTTIDTQVVDGQVVIEPGNVKVDNACFSTIRVEAGDKTAAYYFGKKPYTAKDGVTWIPYMPSSHLPKGLLDRVREGMPLIILSEEDASIDQYAKELASAGAFQYDGLVGRSPAPWMGSWYFVREHPLYEGLPVKTVMKGEYQVAVGPSNGLKVSGPGVEIITAYSKDHSRTIGAGDVITHIGKGKVIFHIVPRMIDPFQKRWLSNAIKEAYRR